MAHGFQNVLKLFIRDMLEFSAWIARFDQRE